MAALGFGCFTVIETAVSTWQLKSLPNCENLGWRMEFKFGLLLTVASNGQANGSDVNIRTDLKCVDISTPNPGIASEPSTSFPHLRLSFANLPCVL